MNIRVLVTLLMLTFCFGCSGFIRGKNVIHLTQNADFKLLGLFQADQEITLNQHFQGAYQGAEHSLDLVTKISKDEIKVIGLAAFGVRAFTMKYDGKNLDFELNQLVKNSEKIKPEYMLADLQLTYYPLHEIRKNISKNIEVEEIRKNGTKRIFYEKNIPIIEISYSSDDMLKATIHYQNLVRKYQYTISNLQ